MLSKIFHLTKRVVVEIHWDLHKKHGSWSWKFIPIPIIALKRCGPLYEDGSYLWNGETHIHFMWLFLDVVLSIEDRHE